MGEMRDEAALLPPVHNDTPLGDRQLLAQSLTEMLDGLLPALTQTADRLKSAFETLSEAMKELGLFERLEQIRLAQLRHMHQLYRHKRR